MTGADLQNWLNWRGAKLVIDGKIGPLSRAALMDILSNRRAPAITEGDMAAIAGDLGISTRQLRAIAQVESSGSGFDAEGRPKILFERHIFHRQTDGRCGLTDYSNPVGGGYGQDSWAKLTMAATQDVDAALCSASWGKFQVMGFHWACLGYHSVLDMIWSMVVSERGHYEALARYVRANELLDAARAIGTDATANRAFARGYNGSAYASGKYHTKLAAAMQREMMA